MNELHNLRPYVDECEKPSHIRMRDIGGDKNRVGREGEVILPLFYPELLVQKRPVKAGRGRKRKASPPGARQTCVNNEDKDKDKDRDKARKGAQQVQMLDVKDQATQDM